VGSGLKFPEKYPEMVPGVIDLGSRHFVLLIQNDATMTFIWWHDCPNDQTWNVIGSLGAVRSGHQISSHDPVHVEGSLLCPHGCGDHGYIHEGKWTTV
jgi:hypothetical protein